MLKTKNTKNALISAILVLCMTFTALLGTTFAWFTDEVTSSGNKIQTGTLKVDLELLNEATNTWKSLKGENDPIFDYAEWEPGYTAIKLLKIENEGTLALKWKTVLTKYGEISALADVIDVYVRNYGVLTDSEAATLAYPADRSLEGYTRVGTAAEFLSTMEETTNGELKAKQSAYLGLALKMRDGAGNEYQGMSLGGTFDITVVATQASAEDDSFGNTYDSYADWPFYSINFTATEPIADKSENGLLTEDVPVGDAEGQASAVVPSGVKLADGAESLDLSIKSMKAPTYSFDLEVGETAKSIDVHIEGVAEDNTVPMFVTLRQLFSKGLNNTNVKLYHIEDGTPIEMTQVTLAELDAHNEYNYDPATGDVTVSVASFSEYTVIEDDFNLWKGEFDTSWYNTTNNEFTLLTANQLAGFGAIVDGGYYTKNDVGERVWVDLGYSDTFFGKTVKLGADIDLSGGYSLNPIGFGYVNGTSTAGTIEGKTFEGTFDGQDHAIFNLYQNGWDIGLSYTNAGGGLFASVHNATIKNLMMVNAEIIMECVEQGVIAGLAQGNCIFENINIYGCSVANYQRATGGVVGEVSWGAGDATEFTHTFRNIKIDSTTVIGSLWGDFDAPVGGVIGAYWDDSNRTKVEMHNVDVACRLDVYNDVTSTYQWYAYRRAGMLIGNTDHVGDDGHTADASFLTCSNVTVRYGNWTKYHYCEFNNHNPSWPWVRVEAGEHCTAYSNPRYGVPNDPVTGKPVTSLDHKHSGDDEHNVELEFNQLCGGGQGVYGKTEHINEDGTNGVTTKYYDYAIQYINDNKVLAETFVKKNTDGSDFVIANDENSRKSETQVVDWMINVQKYEENQVVFGGWVNAGSTPVTSISVENTDAIIKLYPRFDKPYTARFVDQQGNIITWCLFYSGKLEVLDTTRDFATNQLQPTLGTDLELDYWEVHITDDNGQTTTNKKYDEFDFGKCTTDVTVYPVYKFKGDVTLIPVDTNGDGKINYYQVSGYSNPSGQALVEIPHSVNGIPITEISGKAFSSYDGVHSILIPEEVTYIGDNAFAEKWGTIDSGETITIYYGGSYADWIAKEPNFGPNWESGISSSTRIFFLNGGDTVDVSQGYLQAEVKSNWGNRTVTWNHSTTITSDIIKEYTNHCDCGISTTGDTAHIYVDANGNVMDHNDEGTPVNSNGVIIEYKRKNIFSSYKLTTDYNDTYYRYRPDMAYWEGVTAN